MEVPVLNMDGQEVSRVELPAEVFAAKVNRGLMHQALVRQMANARLGTHKAKSRSEVLYTGAKLYRQKGTGRARHGSKRAPIFVGGGVAHGPRPRSYRKDMPKRMRRAALRSALTVKVEADDLVILDEVAMDRPKTKEMAAMMKRVAGDHSVLLLMADSDENVERSARNIPYMKTLNTMYLNIRDLLGYEKVVVPLAALHVIEGWLGSQDEVYVLAEDAEEE
jgi:large subunit ribosomal protein L4